MSTFKQKLDECTHNGKYHPVTCWGIAHALGILALLGAAWVINDDLIIPFAVAGNAVIVVHELKGPGGLFSSLDRILDWVFPMIASVIFIWRT